MLLRETFRTWWQKPRPISDIEEERSVSFLELFYDLSYVVIIAELIHTLGKEVNLETIAGFMFLFSITWWAWVNGSFYHEMHGNNDIRTRVFTFAQMFALAGMAVFIPTALGDGHTGFALSYALFAGIMTFLWWRTGYHDHDHRPMSYPYTLGFAFITGTFLLSVIIANPWTYYMWVVVVAFSILMPLILSRTQRNVEELHKENSQKIRASLVERFGLFTIIALGEVIVSVILGVSHYGSVSAELILEATLGVFIAIAMWWVYFDFVSHRLPIQVQNKRFAWLYLHLPVTMAIAFVGASLLNILEHYQPHDLLQPVDVWLLVLPVSIFLWCIVMLITTIEIREEEQEIERKGMVSASISGACILLVGFIPLTAVWLLVIVSGFLMFPVFSAFLLLVKRMHNQQLSGGVTLSQQTEPALEMGYNKDMKKTIIIILSIIALVILAVIIAGMYKFNYLASQPGYNADGTKVVSFEGCVDAGGEVRESDPRQCSWDDILFVEEVKKAEEVQEVEQTEEVEAEQNVPQIISPLKGIDTGVLIGMTKDEADTFAVEHGTNFRVVKEDGQEFPVTLDYEPGRISGVVEKGVVVQYTVE